MTLSGSPVTTLLDRTTHAVVIPAAPAAWYSAIAVAGLKREAARHIARRRLGQAPLHQVNHRS